VGPQANLGMPAVQIQTFSVTLHLFARSSTILKFQSARLGHVTAIDLQQVTVKFARDLSVVEVKLTSSDCFNRVYINHAALMGYCTSAI